MKESRNLVTRASAHGLILSAHPDGSHLSVASVTGTPVPGAFRAELVAHRAELLAYLRWQDMADRLLLESTRKIAEVYPSGCPLDTEKWKFPTPRSKPGTGLAISLSCASRWPTGSFSRAPKSRGFSASRRLVRRILSPLHALPQVLTNHPPFDSS